MKDLYLNGVRYRPIEGYEDYLVSEDGDVYSKRRRRVLKPDKGRYGYNVIHLSNGKSKAFYAHRLVAKAFIPNPENKPEVNHKDANKINNSASNLEWATRKENNKHSTDNKLHCFGVKNGRAKLTDSQVREIRQLKGKLSQTEIADMFGVRGITIRKIFENKHWRHVV